MNAPPLSPGPCLVVSLVSHGHGPMVQRLLEDMARLSKATVARVVLTHNLPEDEPIAPQGGWPFALDIVRNAAPQGFAHNHNKALKGASEPFLCVINPDIALTYGDPFAELVQVAAQGDVGCAYPLQRDVHGHLQDSERTLITPQALWQRRVLRKPLGPGAPVEWVNGACMVIPRALWGQLAGFDERYFMYCEDVDLCLRIRLAGKRLARAQATVQHEAQRSSHRQWRALAWHVMSLLRLWNSPVYRQAQRMLPADTKTPHRISGS
jgi:N-acetylglucosaminyl-diphospho-decaprenol L-rhamnosyltransferase